jgi:hypothetical protein
MKPKQKPKRKDIYDREIDRLVKMEFDDVARIWSRSSRARQFTDPENSQAFNLFAVCGNPNDNDCGCPTQIVGNHFMGVRAETPRLENVIRAINGIPENFSDLQAQWFHGDDAKRRKLLEPFAIAQRMTDKVLRKLAKEKT